MLPNGWFTSIIMNWWVFMPLFGIHNWILIEIALLIWKKKKQQKTTYPSGRWNLSVSTVVSNAYNAAERECYGAADDADAITHRTTNTCEDFEALNSHHEQIRVEFSSSHASIVYVHTTIVIELQCRVSYSRLSWHFILLTRYLELFACTYIICIPHT